MNDYSYSLTINLKLLPTATNKRRIRRISDALAERLPSRMHNVITSETAVAIGSRYPAGVSFPHFH